MSREPPIDDDVIEPMVFEVSRGGLYVQPETEFTRRWEREYRTRNWIEVDGKFYPRGTVIDPATRKPALRALPAPRRLR